MTRMKLSLLVEDCFYRFKRRNNLHSIKFTRKAGSGDTKGTEFPVALHNK